MRRRVLMISSVSAVVTVILGMTTGATAQIPPDSTIRRIIRDRVESGRSVGIVVGVIDARGQRTFALGGQRPGGPPLDAESVFEIGSITKTFTAILLADMAGRGEVRLSDPVAKFLPSTVRMPIRNGVEITLVDLSTQTSGLPRMPSNFRPVDPMNPYADYSVQQMYDFLSGYSLTRDIGSQYEYSNLGVGLLGHALALRVGRSYEDLLRERVLEPIGMEHTGIRLTQHMRSHLAPGHDASGNAVANWDIPTLAGAGALRSTMSDMLKYLAANIHPPSLPLGRAIALSHIVRKPTSSPSMSIALNWHVTTQFGDSIIWHNGGTGGYHSFMGFIPNKGIGVVVLSNSTTSIDDIGIHLLAPSAPLAGQPAHMAARTEVQLPTEVLRTYAGEYELAANFSIRVILEDGKLFAQATGQQRFQLHAESPTRFFLVEVDAQVTFETDSAGVTGLVLHQNGNDARARKVR